MSRGAYVMSLRREEHVSCDEEHAACDDRRVARSMSDATNTHQHSA